MRRTFMILWAGIALTASAPIGVRAQGSEAQRARIVVEPLFGQDTLIPSGWAALVVEIENLTSSDQQGTLRAVAVRGLSEGMRRELPVQVPAHQSRRVTVPFFVRDSGDAVQFGFEVDGLTLATGRVGIPYRGAERAVVVFGDPPRLRGSLLGLETDGRLSSGAPVGVVHLDPLTSDPALPEDAALWSPVQLLVVSAPMLERVSAPQRRALEDWIITGGIMLVFPRTEADLRRPWLRSLAGELASDGEPLPVSSLHPAGGVRFGLRCVDGQRQERFGCSRNVGFGRVFVAAHDGTSPSAIETATAREIVIALLNDSQRSAMFRPSPGLLFARGMDEGRPSFPAIRRLLDPNEGYWPALVLVALALMFYVLLVGPLNFRWIEKQNKPTLALITTPLIALGCVLVLLVVGYLGKGVTMRYRRVELVDLAEGSSRAAARRYTGLFSTRPGRFDIHLEPGVRARQILASGMPAQHRSSGDDRLLAGFRAGLWETSFVREDRMLAVGGELRLERDGDRIAELVNGTRLDLLGVVLVDEHGGLFSLGDVAAGARAEVPIEVDGSIGTGSIYPRNPRSVRQLARLVGGSDDDLQAEFLAIAQNLVPFLPVGSSVIYARLETDGADIGPFSEDSDTRFVRIVPTPAGSPVQPAATSAPEISPL
ncbi:MAG TPA: hypothetical protein ENK57_19625, partial [Polyangiaceae bacterium]|nr:hypothetical protein [Polyangiaceae bacterium]